MLLKGGCADSCKLGCEKIWLCFGQRVPPNMESCRHVDLVIQTGARSIAINLPWIEMARTRHLRRLHRNAAGKAVIAK